MLVLFGEGNGMLEDLLDMPLDNTRTKTFLQKMFFYGSLKNNSLNCCWVMAEKNTGC